MKSVFTVILIGLAATLAGCNQGTSGGPGATSPPTKKPMTGQVEDTFSMDIPAVSLNQGGTKAITVTISRGKNFSEDVSLKFGDMPKGVTIEPANPAVKRSDKDVEITLKASADAALGDFTVKVAGHPTKGADSVNEFKLSIAVAPPADATVSEAAKAKWDEYTATMQTQWDQFAAKYAELKDSAAKAEGQAKVDLDLKVAAAKVKLDAASARLDELKSASADRWEKVKEGVANAFEDLKKIFE